VIVVGFLHDLKTAFFFCVPEMFFLAHAVQTHLQHLKTAIAVPKPKKALLKVRAGLNEREALGKVVTERSPKRSAQTRSISHES